MTYSSPTETSTLNDALRWRYATKKFDDTRTVSDDDIATLREAVNLAATSFGLQPFRVVMVTDPATKEKLREAAHGQPQMTTASHVFIFAAKTDMSPEYVDAFIRRLAAGRELDYEALSGYGDYIKGNLKGKDQSFFQAWNTRQAYIGLGTLLAAAAELRVDACPMEGIVADKVNEILGLSEQGLTAVVACPVGYRSPEDASQHYAKVRLPVDELFIEK